MIEVVEPGLLTSVQDPFGRMGWRHLGVPVGGAADAWSARLANRLIGNPDEAAVLEMTMHGATLHFGSATAIAVTGGMEASVDGLPVPPDIGRSIRAGGLLRVSGGRGARGYLAVAGGIEVAPVLGSRSTDLRGGFGGFEGRALHEGDRLAAGDARPRPARWIGERGADGPVRIMHGPHAGERFEALLSGTYRASAQADRTGVRLEERLEGGGGEAVSMALPVGAIQVPPDGRPIVMLADRPVTGGYLVPAVVIGADVRRIAQVRPGDTVTFASVSMDEARDAWRRAENELAALEPLDERKDDELGWTGSHR